MAARPRGSLPVQNPRWADLKAAYRFLNSPKINTDALQSQHRRLTTKACCGHPVVLCVQDSSNVDGACVPGGRWVMHSGLAVTPGGEVLGLLGQRFFQRVQRPAKESRAARRDRFRESDVWIDMLEQVGLAPMGTRLIHVADRAADDLRLLFACTARGVGFVVRAMHDRVVEHSSDRLWSYMQSLAVAGEIDIRIGQQRRSKRKRKGKTTRQPRPGRTTRLQVRFAPVQLQSPAKAGHPAENLTVNAVYLQEPLREGQDPAKRVQWMLLTNEPVETLQHALTIIDYYRKRWMIEQWHRALKEGCRLHESQLKKTEALLRLISVLSVVAVRLMQLRQWAQAPLVEPVKRKLQMQQTVPPSLLKAVSLKSGIAPEELTPEQLWRTIAHAGGWLGRNSDPRPGYTALWTGWQYFSTLAEAIDLLQHDPVAKSCG